LPILNVIVTGPINKIQIEFLKERDVNVIELKLGSTEDTLSDYISKADGLITRGSIKITRDLLKSSPRLQVIGVHGLGYGHVDLVAAKEFGKIVCNTPYAHTVTVAEMAMALTLALLRNVVSADKAVRNNQWKRKYGDLIGAELAGKNVGIIGLGRIGTAVAKRMRAFDAEVSYWSRTRRPKKEAQFGFQWKEFKQLIKESDIISLHIPSTPETRQIIGAKEIDDMKDGVFIINTARGKVIDENVLIKALKSGKVKAAALDVFEKEPLRVDNPLCSMDNVILTPHLAASNLEGMQRMAVQVAEAVLQAIRGEEPKNIVV
jgi:D-3-phosphoglycerate dehydrogenase